MDLQNKRGFKWALVGVLAGLLAKLVPKGARAHLRLALVDVTRPHQRGCVAARRSGGPHGLAWCTGGVEYNAYGW